MAQHYVLSHAQYSLPASIARICVQQLVWGLVLECAALQVLAMTRRQIGLFCKRGWHSVEKLGIISEFAP